MKKIFFAALFILPFVLSAQTIKGIVNDNQRRPIAGASVYCFGANEGVVTDSNGLFEIAVIDINNKKLIASHVGYTTDTIFVGNKKFIFFQLRENKTLNTVIVTSQRDGVIISDRNPIKTEQINQAELVKAACCDLAGCFETQTTVQPQTTNVITNSKELRILGLSGVYNQVLIDGFPMMQGLTYTYGISSIPGSLVDNIYVSKGANSVLQGYESISGQINVETKEPDKTDRLFVNAYANNFLEKHLNANYAFELGNTSHLTAFHMVQPANKIDRDQDQFLDLPLLTRYMLSHRWKYGHDREKGWSIQMGLRYLSEKRVGGQKQYDPQRDKGGNQIYGQHVQIEQPEFWAKTGYRFNEKQQLVFFTSTFQQDQHSYFGTVKYDARQNNAYINIQYELNYRAHELKTGISYRYLNLKENIAFTDVALPRTYSGVYQRQENIPGYFAENIWRFFDGKLTWITGIRGDHHNQFGFRITPRTLLKYDVAPKTILRANVGTGWRTVNVFSENIGLLVSSRDIVFAEALQQEQALNYGVNFTQKFNEAENNISGYFSADYYRTEFHNQVFPDYDSDPTKAILQNFKGRSISNGLQAELFINMYKRFEWKTGYNYLDVFRVVNANKTALPFNPLHKWLGSFSYKPLSNLFHLDINIHHFGKQRLPDTKTNPAAYRRPDYSKPYTVLNAQFTYTPGALEVYAGCENIFDFRQLQPIISWEDPFSPYFDTSSVWGPTRGRELYVGLRWRMNR